MHTSLQIPALNCETVNKNYLKYLADYEFIDTVILAARWTQSVERYRYDNSVGGKEYGEEFYLDVISDTGEKLSHPEPIRKNLILESYGLFIQSLLNMNKRVIVVLPVAEMGFDIPNTYAKLLSLDNKTSSIEIPFKSYFERNKSVVSFFQKLLVDDETKNLRLIDPNQDSCSKTQGVCYGVKNGMILYFDDDHISKIKAKFVANNIENIIREMR